MERKIITSRQPLSIEIKKTIIYLLITLSVIIIGLSAYFLMQTGAITQSGYVLKQLQLENENLRQENEKLDEGLTKKMSFPSVEKNPVLKKMAEPEKKIYAK